MLYEVITIPFAYARGIVDGAVLDIIKTRGLTGVAYPTAAGEGVYTYVLVITSYSIHYTKLYDAETVLPANLCPLIKSSYGFIVEGTCPFFAMSEAVIAETTCDGKKKMFELAAEIKPMHVMDLPQLADEPEALLSWTVMIRKLQRFLEKTFNRKMRNNFV